jgi:hypothetical protein
MLSAWCLKSEVACEHVQHQPIACQHEGYGKMQVDKKEKVHVKGKAR